MREAASSGEVPDIGPPNTKEQEAALRPMHYAKVVDIHILRCPTLTNISSVVFHRGRKFVCVELCELLKNIEKEKNGEEKEEKSAKSLDRVIAKVETGLKKSILINASIFATIFA